MIGPGREMKGGIASVVNGYINAGLPEKCNLRYMGTVVEGSAIRKLIKVIVSFAEFDRALPTCDLVHVHMASWSSYERKRFFILRARSAKKPFVIHMHGGKWDEFFLGCSEKKQNEIRSIFESASAVIVLSEEWYDFFDKNICPSSKLRIFHNAVKVPDDCVLKGLGSQARRNILYLGRLDDRKCPDVLIRASADLVRFNPDIRIRFGGDGEIGRYRALAKQIGIEGNCDFLGWVEGEEKEQLFADSGIFCLPSKNEGMPMSVLEAMAHGLAAVATPVGGIPQVIENGVDGFVVPVNDAPCLKNILENLVRDQELRKRIGVAGYMKMRSDFNVDAQIPLLVSLYEELLNS